MRLQHTHIIATGFSALALILACASPARAAPGIMPVPLPTPAAVICSTSAQPSKGLQIHGQWTPLKPGQRPGEVCAEAHTAGLLYHLPRIKAPPPVDNYPPPASASGHPP